MTYEGRIVPGTDTPAALNLLRTAAKEGSLGLREGRVHLVLFIADGRPNLRHIDIGITQDEANRRTERAGNRLHAAKIYDRIYAIGITGNQPFGNTLKVIADPSSLVFPIDGFNDDAFAQLGRDLALQICDRELRKPSL